MVKEDGETFRNLQ
ncbi:Anthocyanin regulatory C1 protein, partial [Actinidia chinensis var. chinensis]